MSTTTNRLKLLAILALFLLPLIAALLIYNGRLPRPSSETINQGTLVQPPVALDWTAAEAGSDVESGAALLGSWVILMPLPAVCETVCLQKVAGLRQVHKATGREQRRLELVLLTESSTDQSLKAQLMNIYEPFKVLADPSGKIHRSLQSALILGELSPHGFNTYLVDPLGNIMMAYDATDSEERMNKDLKRLLTWSKQDKG